MKRIQFYTTGSFFLMTLSAAAETWFAGLLNHPSIFLPSHDLLRILFPAAITKLEGIGLEYFPMFWEGINSTVFQLPLWSIFAITSALFSYLLMTDRTELRRHGKNSEDLEMWAKSSSQEFMPTRDNDDLHAGSFDKRSTRSVDVDPEIWCPDRSSEEESNEKRDGKIVNEQKTTSFMLPAPDFVVPDDGKDSQRILKERAKSANVDPEIWMPITSLDNENTDRSDDEMLYKDEIYEFDEFCEFLDYTESQFEEEQLANEWLSGSKENKES